MDEQRAPTPRADATPPIDLRHALDVPHFESSILIGLDERLREDALSAGNYEAALVKHLRRSLATSSVQLPTVPEAIVRLDKLLRDPDCSIVQVADAVRAEPAIATKVVGFANSSYYAGFPRTASVEGAIARLGMRETKNIVQAVAFGSRLLRVPGWEREVDLLYRRSITAASAARALADQRRGDADEAFMAGLIHDIGRSVLLSTVGEFERTLGRRGALERTFVQHLADGIHADLSALVAEAWNASLTLVVGVRYHHAPEVVAPGEGRQLAHLLQLADDLAAFLVDREAHERGLDEAVPADHRAAVGEVDLARVISQIRRDAAGFDIELASERPARR